MDRINELGKRLYELLSKNNLTVATAESCTGGLIGASLTDIPGISSCYGYGFITYSNEAKTALLGVNPKTLEAHGAVSSETVVEMAEGARKKAKSTFGVSVSGIAGPGGGTPQKRVGTVYVGFSVEGKETRWKLLELDGNRKEVRQQTVINVFEMLIDEIENNW